MPAYMHGIVFGEITPNLQQSCEKGDFLYLFYSVQLCFRFFIQVFYKYIIKEHI